MQQTEIKGLGQGVPAGLGRFYCFRWLPAEDRPGFFVERTLAESREECWAKILAFWPRMGGRREQKMALRRQGGRVVPVLMMEVPDVSEVTAKIQRKGVDFDVERLQTVLARDLGLEMDRAAAFEMWAVYSASQHEEWLPLSRYSDDDLALILVNLK